MQEKKRCYYQFETMLQLVDEEKAKEWNRDTFEKIKAFPQKRDFFIKTYPEAGPVLCKSYDDFNLNEFKIPDEYDESINWYSVMNAITAPLNQAKRFEHSYGQNNCAEEYKFCLQDFFLD